jgi:hypothetical protein
MIEIIPNFFNEKEMENYSTSYAKARWEFSGISNGGDYTRPCFWVKNLIHTEATDLFTNKIKNGINRNVVVDRLYVNGQSHGQSGWWHTDVNSPGLNCFTIVYFAREWLPEYGGHLLIKSDTVISILPEFNKAVLFDSKLLHMGMEPTIYCNTQRESIACKFRVID